MDAQAWLWTGAGAATLLAVVAGFADHRRTRRPSLDDVGWAPWRGIQVASFGILLVLLILSLRR